MLNLAIIEGRIGKDIELKQVGQSVVAKISVATSEKWTDKNTGQKQERTTWHNVEAWGKQAEIISQYFKKGDGIGLQGSIQTDEYEKNGEKRYSTKIKLTSFWFPVSSGQAQNAQQNNGGYQQQNSHQQPQPSAYAQAALNTAQNVVQNTPVGQAVNQQFANGQSVPPAYQNNPQYAPQNPNQQQPNFNNNMQGEPKPSTVDDDIPFIYISNQLTGII